MGQHIEQDQVSTETPRTTTNYDSFSKQPSSAANDNECEGPWPLVPFPEGHSPKLNQPLSTDSFCPSHLYEGSQVLQNDVRSSWRATGGRLTYVTMVSVAMFGWLFVIWLALASLLGL